MPDEQPRRRDADEDRRRWSDDRLDDLADLVRAFAPLPLQVGIAESNIEQHNDELDDVRAGIKDLENRLVRQISAVSKSCEAFHAEYREDQKQSKSANRAVVIALIGSSATVIAAVVAAVAVIVTGGGG